MKIPVHIVNAFVDHGQGGNPAGVVLDADTLSNEQKLLVAQQVGLSETAFVSQSDIAGIKLEFFTPTRQIAYCGHATIATFSYLVQKGLMADNSETSKETIDGIRHIGLRHGAAFMEQAKPTYHNIDQYIPNIISALGIAESDLLDTPSLVNTGNSFIVVGVKNRENLASIQPQQEQINQLSEQLDLIGFYIFTTGTEHEGRDATSRMFAPRFGIDEEAATGMAAGPLACYLRDKMTINKETFIIEQGYFMQPPSGSVINVDLEIDNGNISRLTAGGKGIVMKEMTVEI